MSKRNLVWEDTDEKNEEIIQLKDNNYNSKKHVNRQERESKSKNTFTTILLSISLILALLYFFNTLLAKSLSSIVQVLSLLSIVLFSILFISVGIKSRMKDKKLFGFGALFLSAFFIINILFTADAISIDSSNKVIDLRDKNLTEVVKWAEKNNIELNQEYEYSDMVEEYTVISQNIEAGTKLKDVKTITISISEGPNPYKEMIIPNMISWDSERVINFVKDNYLSNVNVEFEVSDEKEDTVISQDKVGNISRDEEINLVFSTGEEINYSPVKVIDFTNKSKFEAEFYLKQHYLKYSFKEDFDKEIKKGFVKGQSIKAGEEVEPEGKVIEVTVSKGPEIKVPDLSKMTTTEVTDWIVKNKLKLKFSDKYDSEVEKNSVISANFNKGDIISQGTTVEVVISKGKLKMKSFNNLAEFKEWADKYSLLYEEQHEFSNTVKAGEIIKFSYKSGDAIKNNDVIIIVISDGDKTEVPNLVGLSKKEIESKLNKLGLNYNYVYKSSDSVAEGKAIKQSISKGSDVSEGTTITITISTGKAKENTTTDNKQANNSSNKNNNSNSNNNSNNNNSNNSGNSNSSSNTKEEEKKCEVKTCIIDYSIVNIKNETTGYNDTVSKINSLMSKLCPGVSYNIVASTDSDATPGSIISGIKPGSQFETCTSSPYTIVIAK